MLSMQGYSIMSVVKPEAKWLLSHSTLSTQYFCILVAYFWNITDLCKLSINK